jgi:hypothetical protein
MEGEWGLTNVPVDEKDNDEGDERVWCVVVALDAMNW